MLIQDAFSFAIQLQPWRWIAGDSRNLLNKQRLPIPTEWTMDGSPGTGSICCSTKKHAKGINSSSRIRLRTKEKLHAWGIIDHDTASFVVAQLKSLSTYYYSSAAAKIILMHANETENTGPTKGLDKMVALVCQDFQAEVESFITR
ncbi:hypothetical protein Ancab_031773 [Ancistrocladus abbreviatus]